MKEILITVFVFTFISNNNLKAQTLQDSILAINFSHYINKPIDSLINVLPASHDSIFTGAGSSIFVGATVIVRYGNSNIWVNISPGTHNYYTPLNAAHNPPHIAWPLASVRKENTWKIVVWGLSNLPLREICCGAD